MAEKAKGVESKFSIMTMIGLLILIICYIGAIWNIFQVKKDEMVLGKKVIRFCHWQLEMGVRGAMDEMVRLYEEKNKDCKIIQVPISERTYAQWVTTQLIGRTAPDLIEIGIFNVNEYLGRYFMPLTDELQKPNPYNAGNKFKSTPWMNTFRDGLQNNYIPDLVDYYSVGFSTFNIRMFFNKTMYTKIVGEEKLPTTLDEFFAACDKINAYAKKRNEAVAAFNKAHPPRFIDTLPFMSPVVKKPFILSPIATSRYQVSFFKDRYAAMLTAKRNLDFDNSLTGTVNPVDYAQALVSNSLTTEDPYFKASNEIIRDLAKYFPSGFMSIDRMDSGFAFVQGRAAIITSGSWDASSFLKQINDQPFGDIIEEIGGMPVASSAEAARLLMASSGPVKIKINREGGSRHVTLEHQAGGGKDIWTRFGLELGEVEAPGSKKDVVVVTEVDSASPASTAGLAQRRRFKVDIANFPVPTPKTPVYGKLFVGKVAESTSTGFNFGVVKFSKNIPSALDFLRFCTTPENNQKLNEIAQWIPAVSGAEATPFLKKFEPDYDGFWGKIDLTTIGIRSKTRIAQVFWPYVSHETDYEQFAKTLNDTMPVDVAYDFVEMLRASSEKVPDKYLIRSNFLKDCIFPESEKAREDSKKRLAASWDTILNVQHERLKLMAVMGPTLEKRPKNQFADAFFGVYDTISSDKSAQEAKY